MKTKKIILFLSFILIASASKAQFTVEATYDSSFGDVYVVTLEQAGQKFIRVMQDSADRVIYLYNLDYSLWKTINLNNMPVPMSINLEIDSNDNFYFDTTYNYTYSVLYVTQHLFNLDDNVELMFVAGSVGATYTRIVNDQGSVLFATDSAGPWIMENIPQINKPIYNTTAGTKMILSGWNNQAKVYSLEGTLDPTNEMTVFGKGNNSSLGSYPNPNSGSARIEYDMPEGTNKGQIVFYNMNGSEMRRINVDGTSHEIMISTKNFAAGTYFYQLQTSLGNETKKMIVVK